MLTRMLMLISCVCTTDVPSTLHAEPAHKRMALRVYSYDLYGSGLHRYGLHSHDLYSYGLYRHDLYS